MILMGLEGHFIRNKEMKDSTNLNFKHCASTGLNFGFAGFIGKQWVRKLGLSDMFM